MAIISSTNVKLSIGSDFIGTVSNTSVDDNKISLDLEIINDCSDKYTPESILESTICGGNH